MVNAYQYKVEQGEVEKHQVNRWRLIPESRAHSWPDYAPKFVCDDYTEACAIETTSPKASATLSRRCLQAIIRDFFGVSKRTLYEEIETILPDVGTDLYETLHALRDIGNIGAHPERDPSIIVDVEPDEAAMIDLIELLIEETYVARYERDEKLARVKKIATDKAAARPPVP